MKRLRSIELTDTETLGSLLEERVLRRFRDLLGAVCMLH